MQEPCDEKGHHFVAGAAAAAGVWGGIGRVTVNEGDAGTGDAPAVKAGAAPVGMSDAGGSKVDAVPGRAF